MEKLGVFGTKDIVAKYVRVIRATCRSTPPPARS